MIVLIFRKMKVRGMALYPFILLKSTEDRRNPVLINHERIHLRQQIELLILPFYLLYVVNYLYNLIRTGNHMVAYQNIIFEQEAYDRQHEIDYLQNRKCFAFLNYL